MSEIGWRWFLLFPHWLIQHLGSLLILGLSWFLYGLLKQIKISRIWLEEISGSDVLICTVPDKTIWYLWFSPCMVQCGVSKNSMVMPWWFGCHGVPVFLRENSLRSWEIDPNQRQFIGKLNAFSLHIYIYIYIVLLVYPAINIAWSSIIIYR